MDAPSPILRANLDRLARTEPELASRIEAAAPASLTWSDAKAGPPGTLTATIDHDGRPLPLASKYNPLAEADKLIETIDPAHHACAVMLGVGLGYHVAAAAKLLDDKTILIAYEPDVSVLRAVFERIDHTGWLGRSNVIVADREMTRPALTERLEKFGAILTQGTVLVTHPPTRRCTGDALNQFGKDVTDICAYCRTTVATALVNMARTVRNMTANLPHYVAGATPNELHNAAPNTPAVCVSAGPSLARNIELLSDPAVRKNVIVITAQTTLKPLLDRGIRPDFVTALDYHEISRRFYEGLPDLPDVTLVAEPKAHVSVISQYPGPVRVTQVKYLDKLLGDKARPMVPIQAGATVAHLSFYLAQHLGCNPIIMVGQDLGFSDGLYYCPGTAIHDVWAPELNQFNTVEMMEWQRIVRHRGSIKRTEDIHGNPIFTDEQMITYLKQFERDFLRAPQTVIDATEGGVPKEHTLRMSFAEALAQYATKPAPKLPIPPRELDRDKLTETLALVRKRISEVNELRQVAGASLPILRQMLEHQRDYQRFSKLYDKLQKHRKRVDEMNEIFVLVNDLNTIGTYKRARADRAIAHSGGDAMEQQRLQIERDIDNLDFMSQACDEAMGIFQDAEKRLKTLVAQAKEAQPVA